MCFVSWLMELRLPPPPPGFREQSNMVIKLLGTRTQKEGKAGSTGTKAVFVIFYFRNWNWPKSKKLSYGTKEHKGEFCWEPGNEETPPSPLWEAFITDYRRLNFYLANVLCRRFPWANRIHPPCTRHWFPPGSTHRDVQLCLNNMNVQKATSTLSFISLRDIRAGRYASTRREPTRQVTFTRARMFSLEYSWA